MKTSTKTLFSLLALAALAVPVLAQQPSPAPTAAAPTPQVVVTPGPTQPLAVVSGTQRHAFQVELADSEAERNQGLMHRPSMGRDHGMIFDLGSTTVTGFYMKNTLIALDMLFLDEHGKVVAVAANARPGSLRTVSPGFPVRAVLEINGGLAGELGIKPGDTVQYPLFHNVQ
jgi:uncharacterized membrane protein (UPF0127 family)